MDEEANLDDAKSDASSSSSDGSENESEVDPEEAAIKEIVESGTRDLKTWAAKTSSLRDTRFRDAYMSCKMKLATFSRAAGEWGPHM
jgi:hypothetical protein